MYYLNIEKLKETAKRNTTTGRRAKRIIRVLEKDNYECRLCRAKEKLTIDHINGMSKYKHRNHQSYKDTKELQILCTECHMRKNKEAEKWNIKTITLIT